MTATTRAGRTSAGQLSGGRASRRGGRGGSEACPSEVLEAMVEAAQDGLMIATGTGVILHCNARAAAYTGVRKEDMLGRNVEELVRAGYFDRSIALEVIARRADVTLVQTVRDGRKFLVSGRPIFSSGGTLEYVVVTDRDITEVTRLISDLEATTRLSEGYRAELRLLAMREVQAGEIVARSNAMQAVRELALRCSAADSPVLLLGETGTGKGVFAKLIHQASARSAGPFLEVNCGAIPEGLLEAELFGYARGAFTGADPRGKAGLIELAHGGTLLLDEVGDLPPSLQVKLLRFLDGGEIQPVGGVTRKRPDVRILAATNRDLREMLARGTFRADLFYRLNVLTLQLPPLRERREDIPWLIDLMLGQLARKLRRRPRLTPAALHVIAQYPFPGNVRELWNLMERLVVTIDRETIDVGDLPVEVARTAENGAGRETGDAGRTAAGAGGTLRDAVQRLEAAMVSEALAQHRTQRAAARALGVCQASIARKAKQYGLM